MIIILGHYAFSPCARLRIRIDYYESESHRLPAHLVGYLLSPSRADVPNASYASAGA